MVIEQKYSFRYYNKNTCRKVKALFEWTVNVVIQMNLCCSKFIKYDI